MSAAELIKQFRKLAVEEQREVFERISDEFPLSDPTPDQMAVFEERAERLARNPENGISWEKARTELRERLQKQRECPGK